MNVTSKVPPSRQYLQVTISGEEENGQEILLSMHPAKAGAL